MRYHHRWELRSETSDKLKINLGDKLIGVLMPAFLYISVWPDLIEPGIDCGMKNADLRLEKEIPLMLGHDDDNLGKRIVLSFSKET